MIPDEGQTYTIKTCRRNAPKNAPLRKGLTGAFLLPGVQRIGPTGRLSATCLCGSAAEVVPENKP